MRRAQAHYYWKALKTPILVVSAASLVIFSGLSVYMLRSNNLRMLELKQAVYVADETNGDIEQALQNLRAFVNTHMNTRMRSPDSAEPPIQLVGQFNRFVQAEQARLDTQQGSVNQVYKDAQARCETGSIPLTARAKCIQDYVLANGGTVEQLKIPPKELYTYDFASPSWAFDAAGLSIIAACISGLVLITRLLAGRFLKDI